MVDTLFQSLPSLGNIAIFISVLFFTFTILTVILYAKVGGVDTGAHALSPTPRMPCVM